MGRSGAPLHVSLVALPEAMVSTLSGLYEVLSAFEILGTFDDAVPETPPFHVEIVAPERVAPPSASGLRLEVQRTIDEVERTDIAVLPSLVLKRGEWRPGEHAALVEWLTKMHAGGAMLCSACSGVLLIAETGLLDGLEATLNWSYGPTFQRHFPKIRLRLEEALVITGPRREFVMSGASASWHDLALHLIARHAGPTAAQAIARFMVLQWHTDGLAAHIDFAPPTGHGDATVLEIQEWLRTHHSVVNPVEQMVKRSGLAGRSFKRRFTRATGHSPLSYVQHLRVQEAKRRLERTDASVDEISWAVGYEDPAFFRRLFKRLTRLTPAQYRRRFRGPAMPEGRDQSA